MFNISLISTHLFVFAIGVGFAALVLHESEATRVKTGAQTALKLSRCENFRVAVSKLLSPDQIEEAVDDALTMDEDE